MSIIRTGPVIIKHAFLPGIINKLKTNNMKRLIYILFCMMLIMLFAGEPMAQQLVGESEPFLFDTRPASVIPLSNAVLLVFFILAGSLILLRYYLQRRKASV